MPILVIHGVFNRQGADMFRQQAERLLGPCNISPEDIIPVYWGDHASRLALSADAIRSLPPRWQRELPQEARELITLEAPEGPPLSVTPLLGFLDPLSEEAHVITPADVQRRLAARVGSTALLQGPLGLHEYATFHAIEAVEFAVQQVQRMPAIVPTGPEPPLPAVSTGGVGIVEVTPSGPQELFGLGEERIEDLEQRMQRRLEDLVAESLQEGAGRDYSRGLLNINLKKILGEAIAGLLGALVQVGGWGWAVKWLVRKLWDVAYTAWLKDWIKALMRRWNDKLMSILDGLLHGLHRLTLPLVGNFLGDAFAYLRDEDHEIQRIVRSRYDEARARQQAERQAGHDSKLYIVAHSLGGLLAYDLIINRNGQCRVDTDKIDRLITFGSQVGLFHEINPANALQPGDDGLVDLSPYLESWTNVYHELDPIGFSVQHLFRIGSNSSGRLVEKSIVYSGLITTSADGAVVQVGVDIKAEGDPHTGYWKDEDFFSVLRQALQDYPRHL